MQFLRVPVLLPVNCPNHYFEYSNRSKLRITIPSKRHRIHNIAQLIVSGEIPKSVIKLLEMLSSSGFLSHLEELNPNLPGRRIKLV
jgi:hypothetical protein